MSFSKIYLNNFRSFYSSSFDLGKKNLIIGKNGAGKSSFLEAIFFILSKKSFRTSSLNAMINFESSFFKLDAILDEEKFSLTEFLSSSINLKEGNFKTNFLLLILNNFFLNWFMERVKTKYICKYQIKKGIGGLKKLINLKKKDFSTALMIDQRVSEGILSNFFNQEALTTTIPAQLVKKFNIPVVPVYIERIGDLNFKITINNPINFQKETSIKNITDDLNKILEEMILNKPEQWIWSHNRWK